MFVARKAGLSLLVLVGALSLTAGACKNPADGVSQATVGEAIVAEGTGAEAPATQPSAEGTGTEVAEAEVAAASTATFPFSNDGSTIAFVGSKVTGSHDGSFQQFTGTATLVNNDPLQSSVEVTIQTNSVTSDNERLTGHLMSPDFFAVEEFPTATFQSTSIAAATEGGTHTITGNLTLRGTTRSISFPANVRVADAGLELDAEFFINRQDFNIVYTGMPDDLIRNEVVLRLTIRAPRA